MKKIAVLYARSDSVYKTMEECDVYDIERDARTWAGGCSVVAHPPCRAWGILRGLAKPRPDEKELAISAVKMVRTFGGVLEHPKASTLWPVMGLPSPGSYDEFGGFTFPIFQSWFGHKAEKATLLYIVGILPSELPPVPFKMGESEYVIAGAGRRKDGTRIGKGDRGWRPSVTKAEREHTPVDLAIWLCQVALLCNERNLRRI